MFQDAPRYAVKRTLISTSRKYFGKSGGTPISTASASTSRAARKRDPPPDASAATRSSEEPLGPEEKDEDEDDEHHELLERAGQERRAERLGQADDEPAEQRADEIAHAAEHNDDEGHDIERLTPVGRDVEERRDEGARHRRAGRADAEGGRADPRHVDAHEHGALGLLGERADGLAEIREAQEGEERHRHEDGAGGGDEPRQLEDRKRTRL